MLGRRRSLRGRCEGVTPSRSREWVWKHDRMTTATDHRSGWLKWIHRIGYVTTLAVLTELAFAGYLATWDWRQNHEFREREIEESRTHETPLSLADDPYGIRAILLGSLPPRDTLHGDGLRFFVAPALRRTDYTVAISHPQADASQASGILARIDHYGQARSYLKFSMPAAAYRSFVAKFDELADDWPGDYTDCLDGIGIDFERVRGNRVTSGRGNVCLDHYRELSALVNNTIREYAPVDNMRPGSEWISPEDMKADATMTECPSSKPRQGSLAKRNR